MRRLTNRFPGAVPTVKGVTVSILLSSGAGLEITQRVWQHGAEEKQFVRTIPTVSESGNTRKCAQIRAAALAINSCCNSYLRPNSGLVEFPCRSPAPS